MNNKFKAFAILPVAAALMFFGLQAVTVSFAETTGVGETPATTGATADTIEDCEWYLAGVATELELTNDTGMEYVGDDYELTATNDAVMVYLSGSEPEDDRCSFYDDVRGAGVEVSWTGPAGFTNVDTTDTSLDWQLGDALEVGPAVSSLVITYTPVVDSCDVAFGSGDSVSIDNVNTSPLTPAQISDEDTATYTPAAAAGLATFAKCTLNASYSVKLPGGQTPSNPGASYTFTGPSITTTITVNELAGP
jgi:hypothetical protein